MTGQTMGDKEFLTDSISTQKQIESSYNTFANECANPQLRMDFLNILKEEHDIQADLFNEMQRRGWYQIKAANQTEINETKNKYQGMV